MQHRLLVLGSMSEFVDLVERSKRRGLYTIVCDGYPEGPAKQLADASYDIDVRDIDGIVRMCQEERVDGIITSFSDLMAECMVKIADKAGIDCYASPESFRYLRDKNLMKKMLVEVGARVPHTVVVRKDTLQEDLNGVGFPCVVKPVDSYGSRGIYLVSNASEVEDRFDEIESHSSFDYILAEEYIVGHEFNMMNWVVDGEVFTLSVADRETSAKGPLEIPDSTRNVYPSRLIDLVYEEAREIIRKVADYVGITTGPISMQFFYSKGKIVVCEVAGRLFGYEHELVELAGGPCIEELLLDQVYDHKALREKLSAHTPFHETCSAGLYFHGKPGVIASLEPARAALDRPEVAHTLFFYEPGETITHGPGSMPYVLRAYITAPTREQLDELTAELYDRVKICDAEGNDLLYQSKIAEY